MNREALDRAYNNVAAVPNVAETLADFDRRSAAAYAGAGIKRNLAYGAGARQRIDWIPGLGVERPTIAFIHGGYWQSLSKEQFAHVAVGPHARGFNVALIEYTLAPEAHLGEIVEEIGCAINSLAENLQDWGADHNASASQGIPLALT